jgi:hypothetical protein
MRTRIILHFREARCHYSQAKNAQPNEEVQRIVRCLQKVANNGIVPRGSSKNCSGELFNG